MIKNKYVDDIAIDGSNSFQDIFPLSSDRLLEIMDKWDIEYNLHFHAPLKTVNQSKEIQGRFLKPECGGGHVKNLYLRDRKKVNLLIVTQQDRIIDLKKLKLTIGSGHLSFGSEERLMEHLGVRPGAVSPLSMINAVKKSVILYIDIELRSCSKIYLHPLVNDRTVELSIKNLEKFFENIKIQPNWIDL
ncbi:MAG: aminoacyl-tRNA deacylase [Rhodospirillaceae bacterium]|nr:aminoacyl-tRNA deacylase [Rhodospirillaceae bacterium]OUT77961.1 MAG: aminoacyl-tRNA deacylase [Rhodospirillaceae bacterium TMED23]|tara:strand:- start:331 stop:897 length:567 start_codon:yes stop_codon:yes gene_type:complete